MVIAGDPSILNGVGIREKWGFLRTYWNEMGNGERKKRLPQMTPRSLV